MLFRWDFGRKLRSCSQSILQGKAYYPFTIPGMRCMECEQTWAQISTVPILCPMQFRKTLYERGGKPLQFLGHQILTAGIKAAIGSPISHVRPGNSLMP